MEELLELIPSRSSSCQFVEPEKLAPSCAEVLALVDQLYAIEADLPDPYMLEGEQQDAALALRLAVRREKSAPLVTAIREWALSQRSLPGSSMRKALEYMLELWRGAAGWTTTWWSGNCATWWWATRITTAPSRCAAPRWRPSSTR